MNIFNIEYGSRRTLTDMVNYITDIESHTSRHESNPIPFITGFGLTPDNAAQDMLALKQFYGETLHRQYWHIEVSLEHTNYNTASLGAFLRIAQELYQWSGCQLIMAIHTNKYWKNNCTHCHYVLNSVKENGKRLILNKYTDKYQLECLINMILSIYGFGPVNIPHNRQCQAS